MKTDTLVADTLPELEAKIEKYFDEYPRAGYGTTVQTPREVAGKWQAIAERYWSCD